MEDNIDKIINVSVCPKNKDAWIIKSDQFYTNCVMSALKKENYPIESIYSIIQNGVDILSQCSNPDSSHYSSKTGIVIGKVQSGKTSNFISLVGLAFDNNYKIAIILGGNKNNLLKQNLGRIENTFDTVHNNSKVVVLDTVKNKTLITFRQILDFIDRDIKIIIVGLKHQKHINFISSIFESNTLSNIPTLIIDDEGDQATLNTKRYSKNNGQNFSAIYKEISNLKDKIKKHCFISVTATPQANILIDTVDFLSPDFGILVSPGEGYCGLAEFHGENQDKHIKVIPDSEESLLDDLGVPNSVYEALASFFVSNGIRKYRGDFGKHAMLFHPSQKKIGHKKVMQKLQNLLDDWKNKVKIPNDIAYEEIRKYLMSSYESYKSDGVVLPTFENLEVYIQNSIIECSNILLANSDTDSSENSKIFNTNIFLGGNMVERGLTIKGLAITYIIRRAKKISNIDNIEQRARWFGYKQLYLDVCRVYTTQQIKEDFYNIFEHDEAIWDTIGKAIQQGTPFKEIPWVFINNSNLLRMTRLNVAKTQKLEFDQFRSQNSVILDEKIALRNNILLEQFKDRNKKSLILKKYSPSQEHLFLYDLNFSKLKNEIFNNYNFPSSGNLNKNFFDRLEEGFYHLDIDPLVDIVWVRYKRKEERDINESGKILSNLMQGRGINDNLDSYIGDRKLPDDRPNNIQIQVHLVKPRHLVGYNYYSPFFAIYLPQNLTKKLVSLETKKEE